jgi:hypothetical protein
MLWPPYLNTVKTSFVILNSTIIRPLLEVGEPIYPIGKQVRNRGIPFLRRMQNPEEIIRNKGKNAYISCDTNAGLTYNILRPNRGFTIMATMEETRNDT